MFYTVIPAAQEVTRKWSQIYQFFGDAPEIINVLDIAMARF
jgi:hypothetical protein